MTVSTPPTGFVERQFHNRTWWVKAGWEEALPACLEVFQSAIRNPQSAMLYPGGGRGAVQRVALPERGNLIVRHYRRGGFVRHFTRDLYWERPPRPLDELICTEIARQRGVPVVEVIGAGVEWTGAGLYRGILVTREARGYINLWEWLRSRPGANPGRQEVVAAVARAVACMHNAGIAHADLNLSNILVRTAEDLPMVLLIDFDRARAFPGSLLPRQRERNLRRLQRSLNKLDPGGLLSSPTELESFCRAYRQHALL